VYLTDVTTFLDVDTVQQYIYIFPRKFRLNNIFSFIVINTTFMELQ